MGKKSLNRKEAKKYIIDKRADGMTDQEIYHALADQYYDKKAVALLITGTATKEDKEKYRMMNNILVSLFVLIILLRVVQIVNTTTQVGNPLGLVLIFIVPIIAATFAVEIARYNAAIYRLCGIMAIIGFLQIIGKLKSPIDIAINLFFVVSVAGLSFYLSSKLFPKYSPISLQKDNNGDYILS